MHIEEAPVLGNKEVRGGYRLLTLEAAPIAEAVQPGQFVHLKIPGRPDLLLRRPFSVYRSDGAVLSLLFKVVGTGTDAMAGLAAGDCVDLMGPLGRGFPPAGGEDRFPVLVAGGYGMAALFLTARTSARKGLVFAGGRSAADLLCREAFEELEWEVRAATEDGSEGFHGLVTEALEDWLSGAAPPAEPEFFACGPNGMLKAVGELARSRGWKAWLSMDRHMGCGVGACLTCVQRVRQADGSAGWARVCRDGPVFECRDLVWDETA